MERLASKIVTEYEARTEDRIMNCDLLSYNMCNGTGKRTCLTNFPTQEGCLFTGMYRPILSTVKFPDMMDSNDLTEDQRLFICSTSYAMTAFEREGRNNEQQFAAAYIGSSNGIFRVFPGFMGPKDPETGECFNFEPRTRPWYVSTITGPKNTIMLFDTSNSML